MNQKLLIRIVLFVFLMLNIRLAMADQDRVDLINFLYKNSSQSISIGVGYKCTNSVSEHSIKKICDLGLDLGNAVLFPVKIAYKNTNIPQNAVLISKKSNNLLIYNHGHGGLPAESEKFAKDFLNESLKNNDILIYSMPFFGLNALNDSETYKAVLWGNEPKITEISKQIILRVHHQIFASVSDPNNFYHYFTDLPILFYAGAYVKSNFKDTYLTKIDFNGFNGLSYKNVSYVGLSGGATVGLPVCAMVAMDNCILVAGFLPTYLRAQNIQSWGDYEQFADSIYRNFSYEKMMEIASHTSRNVYYLYNRYDPCCFGDPEATEFKINFPKYDIRIIDADQHMYDAETVIKLID